MRTSLGKVWEPFAQVVKYFGKSEPRFEAKPDDQKIVGPAFKIGGLCMRGSIFAKQKCQVCGKSFKNDENRRGCFCPSHPNQQADRGFIVRFGRGITKYLKTYDEAYRFLTGLRYEVDNSKFDPRDYQAAMPLGFENMAQCFLAEKKNKVKAGSFSHLKRYIRVAIEVWGSRNIKTLHYAEINTFFMSLREKGLSWKTIANHRSCYNDFFNWVADMENKQGKKSFEPPNIPEIDYKMGTRRITSKADQTRILDQIKKNTYHINPKIWLGVRWLSIYVAMRPGEMLSMTERDINVDGFFVISGKFTKEGVPKSIPLLDDDIEIVKSLSRGMPDELFFRWNRNYNRAKVGDVFGKKLLYKHWKKACAQLGIDGVDLYGGTRHTTVSALRQHFSNDEIKEHGTRHSTSKAFDRYMRGDAKSSRAIYEKADVKIVQKKVLPKGKILSFVKKE